MPNAGFPFAVRLIGFSEEDAGVFDARFAIERAQGYCYIRLDEDNLQDPDLYVVNADELTSLVALSGLHPTDLRPALLVGTPAVDLPLMRVEKPIHWTRLLESMDKLMEKRADALSRLEASDVVMVPERRRRRRLDFDLTDPAEYEKMRSKVPSDGAVLVVDRSSVLHDYLSGVLAHQNIPVAWVSNEEAAVELCKRRSVAVVLINTSTPGVDPYRLCWAVKEKDSPVKIAVIFLVGTPFVYDAQQARYVGAEGFLTKPLAAHRLLAVLKKFLPFGR